MSIKKSAFCSLLFALEKREKDKLNSPLSSAVGRPATGSGRQIERNREMVQYVVVSTVNGPPLWHVSGAAVAGPFCAPKCTKVSKPYLWLLLRHFRHAFASKIHSRLSSLKAIIIKEEIWSISRFSWTIHKWRVTLESTNSNLPRQCHRSLST